MNVRRLVIASIAILLLLPGCSGVASASNQKTFTGTVMTGAQIGKAKDYCAEGLYLVAEEGYLVDQAQMLLLRIPAVEDEPQMLADATYVGKRVQVNGIYPAQTAFCRALLCACEDYILVQQIDIIQ